MMLLYSHVQRNLTLWLITSLQKVCLLLLRFTKQSSHLTMTAQPAVHVLDISQTLKLSDCTDILALCDTNLDGSIDSVNFSVSGYLPLIQKDSITHMHGLSVYMKDQLPFAWVLSLENSADSYLRFQLALPQSVSYFFFLCWSPSSLFCTVFNSVSSNIHEILLINPSANTFVFGDFDVHYKDWISYSGGTDRPSELCFNLSASIYLTQMVNYPTWIPDCDSQSCSFGFISFF